LTAGERYEVFEQSARDTIPSITVQQALNAAAIGGVAIGSISALKIEGDSEGKWIAVAVLAAIGAIAGVIAQYLEIRFSRRADAEQRYAKNWAAAHGFAYHGSGLCPPNTPFVTSGEKREPEDLFQARADGIDVEFYNMTYVEHIDKFGLPDSEAEARRRFRVMRIVPLAAEPLPVRQLSLVRRSSASGIEWDGELKGKHGPERQISLESVAFNEYFSLSIDASADEIGIRQIFDPATIAALLERPFPFPCLLYYDEMWWTVERDNYKIRDLDDWLPKRERAVELVKLLSRN
jgi:small basic protein